MEAQNPPHMTVQRLPPTAAKRTRSLTNALPLALVTLLILACSLIGGALEDALNPRLRVAHLSARTFRLRPLVGRGKDAL